MRDGNQDGNHTLITRNEARNRGLPRFYTGLPCKNNHRAQRFTDSGKCTQCETERAGRWRANNRQRAAENQKRWRERNPDY